MVMQSPLDGPMGIYLVDAVGTIGLKLSKGQTSARHPDWSPDGTTVAFDSDDDGALWVVGVDGSNPHQLLRCDTGCFALAHPAFSPDGKRVAYVRYEPTTGPDANNSPPSASSILVLDLGTMQSTKVAEARQPDLVDVPRWSSDGTQLAFAIDQFGQDLGETGSTIAVVNAKGGPARRLLPMTSWAYAPDWNRATGSIVYSTEEKDYSTVPQFDQAYDLWTIQPTGGAPTQLTHLPPGNHLVYPTWSPDGSAIVASLEGPGNPRRSAVKVDPTTGATTPLLDIVSIHARLRP
jgi:Tol biopolymer transport system component